MTRIRGFAVMLLLLFVSSFPLSAQDSPDAAQPFDPISLAERYEGYVPPPPLPDLMPIYGLDDTLTFNVGKVGQTAPTEITADLLARGPMIYIWVEEGIEATPGDIRTMAAQIQQYYAALLAAGNFNDPLEFPGFEPLQDTVSQLPVPDADSEPRLFILYTTNLSDDRDGIYNPLDSTPNTVIQRSNGHEVIALNTTPYPDLSLADGIYASAILRAIYKLVMTENNPTQAAWLADALNWRALFNSQGSNVGIDNIYAYFAAPETSLIRLPGLTNRNEVLGGTQLFLGYLGQRAGTEVLRDLFLAPGGIDAIDSVLMAHEVVDPMTGDPVAMRDIFADFVIANLIDLQFGDARHFYPGAEFDRQRLARATLIEDISAPVSLPSETVLPFASRNYRYTARRAESVEVSLAQPDSMLRLPMPTDRDPADTFYYSGVGSGRDATLTQALDLTSVESATLTFDVWHDLIDGWNYGYVSVSTDGGATWTALASEGTVEGSRYGTTFGAAFGGISNPDGTRPFPILGATIGGDGITIQGVSSGGPAEQGGLQAGDAVVGYDGHEWESTPNIIALMGNYAPGDTINFFVQRGRNRFDLPVVLGAHPTRVFTPPPLWQTQTIDLTPYAGQEIQLRFEYVSMPLVEDRGFGVDNIAVPEIDFLDRADGDVEGWTFAGWSAVNNLVPQQLLVQSITSGTQTEPPRVRRLQDIGEAATDGTWQFDLAAGETLYIAVSGINGDTDQPASYDVTFQSAD